MSPIARLAAVAVAALASLPAGAREFPPMGVMGPYDTPDMAADRIVLPEQARDIGPHHVEAGVENANAIAPDVRETEVPVLDVVDLGGGHERREGGDKPEKESGKPDKPDKPDKPGGHGRGGD